MYLEVTYSENSIHVDWGVYHTMGIMTSKKSCFSRSGLDIIDNKVDEEGNHWIEIILKNKTKFRISNIAIDSNTFVISEFNGSTVTDLDVLDEQICDLIIA